MIAGCTHGRIGVLKVTGDRKRGNEIMFIRIIAVVRFGGMITTRSSIGEHL